MAYKLRCPGCAETFRWTGKSWPKFCPICGYSTALPQRSEIQAPLIGKPQNQVPDRTYRQYEQATEQNAQEAASMLGVPVEEMSGLKVTNMETSLREGDLAVKPVSNEITRFMDSHPQQVGQMQQQAMVFAANAHQGKGKYAGASGLGLVRKRHAERGGPSSDHPTMEVYSRAQRAGGRTTF
ncbi:MAG: hypothetical protein KGL39_07665 [Patescibacteria group bacterium]|nr:hypothetical protein [Patescibacteria group bacterium]